jgi:hypothetical protein
METLDGALNFAGQAAPRTPTIPVGMENPDGAAVEGLYFRDG